MTMPPGPRSLRLDAQANRGRILDVARRAFAADPGVSLNAIAKEAGVGPGTLYRHFPSREALVLAIYRQEIEDLLALAPALMASHRPAAAFRLWCDRLAEFGRVKHGVAAVLHAAISDRGFDADYWPVVEAIGRLLRGGEAAGEFHPGTEPEDLLHLLGVLWRLPPGPDGERRAARLLDLITRGLRTSPEDTVARGLGPT